MAPVELEGGEREEPERAFAEQHDHERGADAQQQIQRSRGRRAYVGQLAAQAHEHERESASSAITTSCHSPLGISMCNSVLDCSAATRMPSSPPESSSAWTTARNRSFGCTFVSVGSKPLQFT